jgi:hypothetical protein
LPSCQVSGASLVIVETGVEDGEVEFVVYNMVKGEFESAGLNLVIEMDGNKGALFICIWPL